jgi:hypothetical protein
VRIPNGGSLAEGPRPIVAVAETTTSAPALDAAWPAASAHRHDAKLASNGWPTKDSNLMPQPLSPTISPAQKAGLPHTGELPALRGFQWVSCTIIRDGTLGFH